MNEPRVARWILRLVTVRSDRSYILDDLAEDYAREIEQRGPRLARRWYRSQVLRSILPSLKRRSVVMFRGLTSIRRTRRGQSHMDTLWQDIRFAVRTLRKRPAFTTVAILSLSLGIGANTAIFSLVNGVLFKGVPGGLRTEGLAEVIRIQDGRTFDLSFPVFQHLRAQTDILEDAAAFTAIPMSVSGHGEPTVYMAFTVTGNYLSFLGLTPAAGRFFAEDKWFHPNVQDVVVISHRLWQARFGGSMDVIGKVVRLNGRPVEVIGVAPAGFHGHAAALVSDVFVPIGARVPGLHSAVSLDGVDNGVIEVLGRLRSGVSPGVASEALSTAAGQYRQEVASDAEAGEFNIQVTRWGPVPSGIRAGVAAFFSVLMVIVGLVLTMACINVTNMLLVRAAERHSEIAIRLAMGAPRVRMVRQLVTEALVLFVVAAGIGLAMSVWLGRLLMSFKPPLPAGINIALDVSPDFRVAAFAIGIALVTGIVFSLIPALRAARPDLISALKDTSAAGGGAPLRSRWRATLVGAQMAVTLVLLIAAGLFLRSLTAMRSLDPGWDAEGVVATGVDLELAGYERERGKVFQQRLVEGVGGIPGVTSVALARKLPLSGRSSLGRINVAGVPAPEGEGGYEAFFNTITADYFTTLRIQLLNGRSFDASDTEAQGRVAVINRAMAQRFWPDESPIGRRFFAGEVGSDWGFTVIGVVENAKYRRLDEETTNFYYLPYSQRYNAQMELLVKTAGQGTDIASAVRSVIHDIDPGLPVQPVQMLADRLELFVLPQRLAAWVSGVMGIIGLALAIVGIYGVTAFTVGQRTREIGVRMALGARSSDILRTMAARSLRAPLIGMVIGLVLAAGLSRLLSQFLAGLPPLDTVTFGAVVLILVTVTVLAVLLPVRRAAARNPVDTLRSE